MKKLLSVLLVFIMVLGMLPMTAFADDMDEAVTEVTEEIEAAAETPEAVEAVFEEPDDASSGQGTEEEEHTEAEPVEEETETPEPEEEPQTEASESGPYDSCSLEQLLEIYINLVNAGDENAIKAFLDALSDDVRVALLEAYAAMIASEADADDTEEEEIVYAEQSLTAVASDGAVVTVAGYLPVGTELAVEKVFFSAAEVAELLGTAVENVEDYVAYDITLLLDGEEIEPDGEVSVVIMPPADFSCEEDLSIVHIEDSGASSEVPAEVSENGVAFSLDSFSIVLLGAKRNPDTVAVIGDAEYTNLAEAFAAAEDGDTVQLVKNVYYDGETISVSKDVTFDCNNHKLTNPSSSYVFDVAASGKLSFVNLWTDLDGGLVNYNYGTVRFVSTGFAGASCGHSSGYFVYYNYGAVEVLGGQYTDCYAFVEYTGEDETSDFSVTITGGSFCGEYIVDYVYGKSTVNVSNVTAPNIYCWIYELCHEASVVIEDSTFTSTGYFIEYAGDEEGDEGISVTLRNVTARSYDESFYEVRGTLTAEDCVFISTDNDFIEDTCEDTFVVLTDVNVSAGDDLFDDVYGYAEINGGTYDCGECIFDSVYGTAVVNGGSFTAGEYGFDDVYGNLTANDCEVTANYDALYCSSSGSSIGHVVINGGTYISKTDESIYVSSGSVEITDGVFTSLEDGDSALYISDGAEALLSGGVFTAGGDVCAFNGTVENDGIIGLTVVEGYHADPAEWLAESASVIEIKPDLSDIIFLNQNGSELYRETVPFNHTVANWPGEPEKPANYGEDYLWWGWVDADGNRFGKADLVTEEKTLTPKWVNEGVEDPEDPVDPVDPVIPDPVVVTSYDELKAALEAREPNIVVSGTIEYPAGNGSTLIVYVDTHISGMAGAEIIGNGSYAMFKPRADLTMEDVSVYAGSSNMISSGYSGVKLNILSGYYEAVDDVINTSNVSVNLYGGKLVELEGWNGEFDGPIHNAPVYYQHTLDADPAINVIDVVPAEKFDITYYNGDTVVKTENAYEGDVLLPPTIDGDDFLGWFDESGNRYNYEPVAGDMNLYARFKEAEATVTFVVDGVSTDVTVPGGTPLSEVAGFDAAPAWEDLNGNSVPDSFIVDYDITLYATQSLAVVTTLDEFKEAVAGSAETILVAAKIPVTETLVVDRSVDIAATSDGSLIRPSGFEDVLLLLEPEEGESINVSIGSLLIDGRYLPAYEPAVYVEEGVTLSLNGTSIRNNVNNNRSEGAGGLESYGDVRLYDGTSICSNTGACTGGILTWTPGHLYMYGGEICHNTATEGSHGGGAGGAGFDNIHGLYMNYAAFKMYGGKIHHNVCAEDGGGVGGPCGDDGVFFEMYGGEITNNRAEDEGGGVYTACATFYMYGGLIAGNEAKVYGGGVSTCCGCDDNGMHQYGGIITQNVAEYGGGVCAGSGHYLVQGRVFGNYASKTGDDIYNANWSPELDLIASEAPLSYPGEISLAEVSPEYKALSESRPTFCEQEPITGYPFTRGSIAIPFIGWQPDDSDDERYTGEKDRQLNPDSSLFAPDTDVKAVFGGYFLVYDANNGTGDYIYDENAYVSGTKAKTIENPFTKGNSVFVGWNTEADGSGDWYYPQFNGYNKILMDDNYVLYAQWVDYYAVTYVVDADPDWGVPDDSVTPEDDKLYESNADVTVADNLTTTQNYGLDPDTGDHVPGVWSFTTWDHEDFQITEDTEIRGGWIFTPDVYAVTYVVNEDSTWGIPEDSVTPEDKTEYAYKGEVRIAENLITTQDYAVDQKSGNHVPGAWIFTPWDKEDFQITEDTTVTGSWTFTPDAVKVQYVVNADAVWGVPEDSTTPSDTTAYHYNDSVTVADNLTTTQNFAVDPATGDHVPGTWSFISWDKEDFQITENTTITGSWSFTPKTFKVEYEVNGDKTYGMPDDSVIPTDDTEYNYKDLVDIADNLMTTQEYGVDPATGNHVPGTWSFTGWDKNDFKITEDTVISGSWQFTPNAVGSLTIKKTVTGDEGDRTKYFTFTVTFDAEGSYSYTGSKSGTVKSGDAILLKHGESITIQGLPAGTVYSVTESGNTGYRVYVSGDTGTIIANGTSTAAFTNAKSKVPVTGDTTNLPLWLGITGVSGIGMLITSLFGDRRKRKNNPVK